MAELPRCRCHYRSSTQWLHVGLGWIRRNSSSHDSSRNSTASLSFGSWIQFIHNDCKLYSICSLSGLPLPVLFRIFVKTYGISLLWILVWDIVLCLWFHAIWGGFCG